MNFKLFLLNENKSDLGLKLGNIINAIDDLSQDIDKKGQKLNVFADDIIARVKAILRSDWPSELSQYLKQIRNALIVICKSMDGSNEMPLPEALKIFLKQLKKISENLGSPITDVGTPPSKKPEEANLSSPENKTGKPQASNVPKSVKLTEPVSPSSLPQEPEIPLGGSTGTLKNI